MLTDIFETRYANRPIWTVYTENERRFLVQASHIVAKQLFPVWDFRGDTHKQNKAMLQSILDKVALEVGVSELHPKYYTYTNHWQGKEIPTTAEYSLDNIYKNLFSLQMEEGANPDRYIKRCLSVVELAFRYKEGAIIYEDKRLEQNASNAFNSARPGSLRVPGHNTLSAKIANDKERKGFLQNVDELNTRFEQASFPLAYHNGFIQIKADLLVAEEIEKPFWELVAAPEWSNVDHDMKYAVDQRDTGGRDPAWYAAKALESAIKIISDQKGWTTGNEKGAHQYIDHLVSEKNRRFIEVWESDAIKSFFSKVRAPFGHGAGSAPMPALTESQTDWAIEFCMSWIKSLIRRFNSTSP